MQKSQTLVKSKLTTIFVSILLAATAMFLPFTQPIFAANSNINQNGGFVPCGNTADNPCRIDHLFYAFVIIVNYLIYMAGFVAVAAIVYAGFLMVTSQGQDRLIQGKRRLTGAIVGLFIVAAAFVLINALFAGSLSIGVKNGTQILTNPRAYISGNSNTK